MSITSIIRAVIVASLAALPSSMLFLGFEGSVIKHAGWLGTALLVYLTAVIGCTFIGLPIHFILTRKHSDSKFAYVITGFMAPLVILALGPIITMDWKELVNPNNIELSLVLAIAGAAVAVALHEVMKIK